MTQKNPFGFDSAAFTDMFKMGDLGRYFDGSAVSQAVSDSVAQMKPVDMDALMVAQRKNMEALVEANKAMAEGYQGLFKKQLALFEEAMEAARERLAEVKLEALDAKSVGAEVEKAQAAFDKAMGDMGELAEAAKKTNMQAFEIVSARVKESLGEFAAEFDAEDGVEEAEIVATKPAAKSAKPAAKPATVKN